MKKVFALALAVMMIFAVSVPAFAAASPTTVTTPGNTEITVSTTSVSADEWYEVYIPADQTIAWGNTNAVTSVAYTANCQLASGKSLYVKIASTNSNKLQNTAGKTIAYTPAGFAEQSFAAVTGTKGTNPGVAPAIAVSITVPDWSGVAIDTYSDTLTYTVEAR